MKATLLNQIKVFWHCLKTFHRMTYCKDDTGEYCWCFTCKYGLDLPSPKESL